MKVPHPFWRFIGLLCLWCLPWVQDAAAQEVPAVSAIPGVTNSVPSGITYVLPGGEVLLYSVRLSETVGGDDADLKTLAAPSSRIEFTISNSGFGVVVGADITSFNFYRSADAVFDGGDLLLKSPAPGALPGFQTIPFNAPPISAANADIPIAPLSIFFLITATIAPGATIGNSFVLSTIADHIDLRDTPGGTNYTRGTVIAANDANRIVIGTAPVGSGGSASDDGAGTNLTTDVPLEGEWLLVLLILTCGIWTIRPSRCCDGGVSSGGGTP